MSTSFSSAILSENFKVSSYCHNHPFSTLEIIVSKVNHLFVDITSVHTPQHIIHLDCIGRHLLLIMSNPDDLRICSTSCVNHKTSDLFTCVGCKSQFHSFIHFIRFICRLSMMRSTSAWCDGRAVFPFNVTCNKTINRLTNNDKSIPEPIANEQSEHRTHSWHRLCNS